MSGEARSRNKRPSRNYPKCRNFMESRSRKQRNFIFNRLNHSSLWLGAKENSRRAIIHASLSSAICIFLRRPEEIFSFVPPSCRFRCSVPRLRDMKRFTEINRIVFFLCSPSVGSSAWPNLSAARADKISAAARTEMNFTGGGGGSRAGGQERRK